MASDQSAHALSSDVPVTAVDAPEQTLELPEQTRTTASFPPDQVERCLFEVRSEQSLLRGAVVGAVAGAVGAFLWAAITVATMFQIGWLAVGIGFLVGAGVRWGGRGVTTAFGVVGAAIALISVVAGNFLSLLGILAGEVNASYLEIATQFDYSQSLALMAATFSPIDLLFYGIAVWEGYRFSIREITGEEIHDRLVADGVTPTPAC